jgi:hypothetical protein
VQHRFDRNADSRLPARKEGKCRHNFESAASITLMSVSPEPPERLAEILLEVLALSKPARTSQSESASGSDPSELSHAYRVEEHSQRRAEEANNHQIP